MNTRCYLCRELFEKNKMKKLIIDNNEFFICESCVNSLLNQDKFRIIKKEHKRVTTFYLPVNFKKSVLIPIEFF